MITDQDLITVEDDHLRGDGRGTHHAAQVGPGVLCAAVRSKRDYSTRNPTAGHLAVTEPDEARPSVQTVSWEPGIANVDCAECLQLLVQQVAA